MVKISTLLGCLILIPASAQVQGSMQSTPPAGEQASTPRADTLVQSREADQERRRGALRGRGAEGRLVAMRAIVRAHFRARPRGDMQITNSARLPAQDQEDVALLLSLLGYDPSTLQGQSESGRELVSAASEVLFGSLTIDQQMKLAPEAYVVRVAAVDTANIGDGYHTIARVVVSKAIKGNVASGSELLIKQRTGPTGNGEGILIPGEFLSGQEGEYLVFPSAEMYKFRANARITPDPKYTAVYLPPYRIVNGVAHATTTGQKSSGFPLSSLSP